MQNPSREMGERLNKLSRYLMALNG
jgi:hypothetical protein